MDWYLTLKTIHISCVGITFALLITRLSGDITGFDWRATALRFIPHINDTLLLIAGFSMLALAEFAWLSQKWLVIKLILLPCYIIFGKLALDLQRTKAIRISTGTAAIITFITMVALAFFKPIS